MGLDQNKPSLSLLFAVSKGQIFSYPHIDAGGDMLMIWPVF